MAHYALLNSDNIVIIVTTSGEDFDEKTLSEQNGQIYKKTSYNTAAGVHVLNGIPFRKNYAGIGYFYDENRDAFIPPKTYDSWVLDEFSCVWVPPKQEPNKDYIPFNYRKYNNYIWDETVVDWVLVKPFESWLLTNNYFISPIPHPNDELDYFWNEYNLSWVLNN